MQVISIDKNIDVIINNGIQPDFNGMTTRERINYITREQQYFNAIHMTKLKNKPKNKFRKLIQVIASVL